MLELQKSIFQFVQTYEYITERFGNRLNHCVDEYRKIEFAGQSAEKSTVGVRCPGR